MTLLLLFNLHPLFLSRLTKQQTNQIRNRWLYVFVGCMDDELDVHEDFIGLYETESIIHDVLNRLNISITKLRGQCYDDFVRS